jgi:hypothetical protein
MFRRRVPEARDQLTAQELQIISEARGHFPGRARSGASIGRADAFSHATRRACGYVDKPRRGSRRSDGNHDEPRDDHHRDDAGNHPEKRR